MTDTTDIKALREEVERLREELLVERNAAINLSNHLSDCAGKLRAANAELAALKGEQVPVAYSGWAVQYRENTLPKLFGALEIAELNCYEELGNKLLFLSTDPQKPIESDQVPFRYMAEWSSQYGGMEYDYSEVRSEMDEVAAEHDGSVIELFTTPQKPVVLPEWIITIATEFANDLDSFAYQEFNDDSAPYIARLTAAIEASGGSVKDGE